MLTRQSLYHLTIRALTQYPQVRIELTSSDISDALPLSYRGSRANKNFLERIERIELLLSAWKADVLTIIRNPQ